MIERHQNNDDIDDIIWYWLSSPDVDLCLKGWNILFNIFLGIGSGPWCEPVYIIVRAASQNEWPQIIRNVHEPNCNLNLRPSNINIFFVGTLFHELFSDTWMYENKNLPFKISHVFSSYSHTTPHCAICPPAVSPWVTAKCWGKASQVRLQYSFTQASFLGPKQQKERWSDRNRDVI